MPVSKNVIEKVVKDCHRCRCVDPNPVKCDHNTLDVTGMWMRLAIRVTHVAGSSRLSVIDCGPSRFTIWRKLRNETTDAAIDKLNNIFRERGAPSYSVIMALALKVGKWLTLLRAGALTTRSVTPTDHRVMVESNNGATIELITRRSLGATNWVSLMKKTLEENELGFFY